MSKNKFRDLDVGTILTVVVLLGVVTLFAVNLFSKSTNKVNATAESNSPSPSKVIHQTPADAVPGSVIVRTRRIRKNIGRVDVRCVAETERLIGGGCDSRSQYLMMGYPVGYGAADTSGAGWECTYGEGTTVNTESSALALCQVVGDQPPPMEKSDKETLSPHK